MKNDLKIFTENIEEKALNQIYELLNQDAFRDSKVRIMPDVHAGKSCVIGFTGDLGEKVIPNIVGGDIGCGMICVSLGNIDIDYSKLDQIIHRFVPSGQSIHEEKIVDFDLKRLLCYDRLKKTPQLECSLGTLGGGNHFIEIDEEINGEKYLVIHTGSRNLGTQVALFYQKLADMLCNSKVLEYREICKKIIEKYRKYGREKEISMAIEELRKEYNRKSSNSKVPYDLAYLEGKYRDAYLHDMKICQEYAKLNRYSIAKCIADHMGWKMDDYFESVHNYIDVENNIVRKGAISAKKGERVIIPMNMRDGCIIGVGKGNADWNYSAPHGAGRIMSRAVAKAAIKLDEYKKSMDGIYTSSVNEDTIDEAPFAYKPMDEIVRNIEPTVEITRIIKPVYNFKASEVKIFNKKDDEEKSKQM